MNGPTTNLNTTAACALVVFFSYHWIGVRKHGAVTYLKHFMGPVPLALKPLMFVIEIISHLARPLSLTLRLFGNMFGGHILLAIIFFLMGLQGLIGWALSGSGIGAVVGGIGGAVMIVFTVGFLYPLKILVSFLQAFIFVHAHDALHLGRGRGSRAPWRRAPTGASLSTPHVQRRRSCDVH